MLEELASETRTSDGLALVEQQKLALKWAERLGPAEGTGMKRCRTKTEILEQLWEGNKSLLQHIATLLFLKYLTYIQWLSASLQKNYARI